MLARIIAALTGPAETSDQRTVFAPACGPGTLLLAVGPARPAVELLTSVLALPPGLVSNHALPVHLWELRQLAEGVAAPPRIRMVDLGTATPESIVAGADAAAAGQVAEVPLIDVLDEGADLSPGRWVVADRGEYPVEHAALCDQVRRLAEELLDLLPELSAGPGRVEAVTVGMGDLVRGGLVELDSTSATSQTDQLDTDYLRGFLHSAANTHRSTTATGTFRLEARSAQFRQMDIDRQREYGAAFRRPTDFEDRLREVAVTGERASRLAFDGLTNGAVLPTPGSPSVGQGECWEGWGR